MLLLDGSNKDYKGWVHEAQEHCPEQEQAIQNYLKVGEALKLGGLWIGEKLPVVTCKIHLAPNNLQFRKSTSTDIIIAIVQRLEVSTTGL